GGTGAADDWHDAGQDRHVARCAAVPGEPGLEARVCSPRFGRVAVHDRKHNIGRARREVLSRFRTTRLDDERMAVGGPFDIEGPAHLEVPALVIERPYPCGIHVDTRLLAPDAGAFIPGVPQPAHDVDE